MSKAKITKAFIRQLEKFGLIDHSYGQHESMLVELEQVKWLLTQCPLMNAIAVNPQAYSARMPNMRVYINPKTYRKMASSLVAPRQWVLTELLPEDGMICSPKNMPGIAPLPEKKS